MKQRRFQSFAKFFCWFLTATNITVGNIWFLFLLHHCDSRVSFWWERKVYLVLVPIDSNTAMSSMSVGATEAARLTANVEN